MILYHLIKLNKINIELKCLCRSIINVTSLSNIFQSKQLEYFIQSITNEQNSMCFQKYRFCEKCLVGYDYLIDFWCSSEQKCIFPQLKIYLERGVCKACVQLINLSTGFNQLCIVATSASNEVMCDSQLRSTILQLLSAKQMQL